MWEGVIRRIGKARLISSTFLGVGAIKAVSFSRCGVATWDSVIDCGRGRCDGGLSGAALVYNE